MSVYITTTINSTDHYVSNEFIHDIHMWDAKVEEVSNITSVIEYQYGGYMRPQYGSITFIPTLFKNDFPPPETIESSIKVGDTESGAIQLCESLCSLGLYDREIISYNAIGTAKQDYDSDNSFSGTLIDMFNWACDSSRLNYTLDTTHARTPSPAISKTLSGDNLIVDMLSEASAYFSHYFYIEGNTLYLIDMFANTGSKTLSEFDYTPVSYQSSEDISLLTSGGYSILGSTPSGHQIDIDPWHTAQSNIESALQNIKISLEKDLITLELSHINNNIAIGNQVTFTDQSMIGDTTTTFIVTKINFNISVDDERMIIEGRGITTSI